MTSYQFNYVVQQNNRYARPIKVTSVRQNKSRKSRTCVYCGTEICKGDLYYSYKVLGGKRKSRCLNDPPKIYNDYEEFDI